MSAILAGRLGSEVERHAIAQSSNHSSVVAAVQKRVVVQKRMQFSIMSCSYTAQCLGASCMKPTDLRPLRMWEYASVHLVAYGRHAAGRCGARARPL